MIAVSSLAVYFVRFLFSTPVKSQSSLAGGLKRQPDEFVEFVSYQGEVAYNGDYKAALISG